MFRSYDHPQGAHTLFLANVFCIIHILYTGCVKIKKKIRGQKVNDLKFTLEHLKRS